MQPNRFAFFARPVVDINVLDSQRSYIQARQSLAMSQRGVKTAWGAVNRAVGNYPR